MPMLTKDWPTKRVECAIYQWVGALLPDDGAHYYAQIYFLDNMDQLACRRGLFQQDAFDLDILEKLQQVLAGHPMARAYKTVLENVHGHPWRQNDLPTCTEFAVLIPGCCC